MSGKLTLAIIIVIGGVMAWTNPSITDFQKFTESQSRSYLEDELGDNAIGRALAEAGSSIAGEYVDELVDRKNYVLFSIFEVGGNIGNDDAQDGNSDWRYLGIARQFVRLDSN